MQQQLIKYNQKMNLSFNYDLFSLHSSLFIINIFVYVLPFCVKNTKDIELKTKKANIKLYTSLLCMN